MSEVKNIPAFPRPAWDLKDPQEGWIGNDAQDGMTLLDYFAGQAMPSVIAARAQMCSNYVLDVYTNFADINNEVATASYEIAAAMLDARKRYI